MKNEERREKKKQKKYELCPCLSFCTTNGQWAMGTGNGQWKWKMDNEQMNRHTFTPEMQLTDNL